VALPLSTMQVTYAILGTTVAIYVLQLASVFFYGFANQAAQMDWLEFYGARINQFIRAGQIWRLLTPALLHASIPHILFNMYALVSFGGALERFFGGRRFLLLYLLAAFSGNVFSFLLGSERGYSVGASTAIFGLVGAQGVFLYQNRRFFGNEFGRAIGNVIFIIAINLFLGSIIPAVDNWGHVGGLLGGLVFTWFAGPRWAVEGNPPDLTVVDERGLRELVNGTAAVLLIFGSLAVLGLFSGSGR
jgi:rhomboid protease GluP